MTRALIRLLCLTAIALPGSAVAQAASPPDPTGVLTPAQAQSCERLGVDFARTGTILKMLRAFKGPDGNSKIEEVAVDGKIGSYYGGKVTLTQFGLGDPSFVGITYGHPNIDIPVHPSPYREIFLILSGSSTVTLADGTTYHLTPGTMLLSEDQDTPGRGGKAGPCGYVAIDLQFKAPAK